jgi:ornithine decarboxylase
MTISIETALIDAKIATPCLVLDRAQIAKNYKNFCRKMVGMDVFYAVKANPHPDILSLLAAEGAYFDCASFQEITLVLAAGGHPSNICFGSTLKKVTDIADAYKVGVRSFTFDAREELQKIADHAPGSNVCCRILTNHSGTGAQWPLSRKFGCDENMAVDLMSEAGELGLIASGISFHVGSQQTEPTAWHAPIAQVSRIFRQLADLGIALDTINLGGGFPTTFGNNAVPDISIYANIIKAALNIHFGDKMPRLIAEPGRALVGDAGVIVSEVVLVSQKSSKDLERWVYLDVGRFHGLAETEGEAIRYRFTVPERQDSARKPAIIAGPTCDSVDTLYERNPVEMPIDLKAGDIVLVHDTGAYTATYSSVGFNGLSPLGVCLVEDINQMKFPKLRAI